MWSYSGSREIESRFGGGSITYTSRLGLVQGGIVVMIGTQAWFAVRAPLTALRFAGAIGTPGVALPPGTSARMNKSPSRRAAGLVLALCSIAATALLVPAAPAMAAACPNEQLRAEDHSTTLPDCRSYELVTPPFKEAAEARIGTFPIGANNGIYGIAPSGQSVDVNSTGDFGDAKNGYFANSYKLTRTESGWTEENLDLPVSDFPESRPLLTSPELGPVLYFVYAGEDDYFSGIKYMLREAGGTLVELGTGGAYGLQGVSADLSHVLINEGNFEYIAGHPSVQFPVGVEPDGSLCAASFAGSRFGEHGFGPISADGSTVFFNCSEKLFARIDNGEAGAYTVAISTGPATFAVASPPNGNDVFYFESGAFYRFEISSGTREEVLPAAAGVSDVVGINETDEDGEYLYFDAKGALTGPNAEGRSPTVGEQNLYVLERDAQFPDGELGFIATVSPGNTDLTPSGQFLVFTSTADLTPGDTSTARQLFEYDAQTGSLVRVSIGQNGFNDNGNSDVFPAETAEFPVVSDNGEYVAFQSADALTPQALAGSTNVYEYHDGNVYLISDGQAAAKLRGMSASGDDIFFETIDQLVAQDMDTQVDVYDARVDGGFPASVSLLPTCQGDACQGPLSPAPTLLSPGSEFQAGGNPPLTASEQAPAAKTKPKAKRVKCKKGSVKKNGKCVKTESAKKARKVRDDRRTK